MLSFIFGPLVWLKNYLSHIRKTSWHYKLVHGIWGSKTSGKACTYYWLKLPSSALAYMGLIILVIVFGIFVLGGGWFFGYVATTFKTEDPFLKNWLETHKDSLGHEPGWYPYRYTSKGKKRHVLPWQVVLTLGSVVAIWYFGVQNQNAGIITGIVVGITVSGVLFLAAIVFLISKSWRMSVVRSVGSAINSAWDKACPPLIVEPETKQSETAT